MEGASASGQRAWPPHRGSCEEHGRHGEPSGNEDTVHTRRRYTVALSAAALIAAVCCVTAFMGPQTPITTLEEVSAASSSLRPSIALGASAKTPKAMEADISKRMKEVRQDSLDEQRAVQRRERVELQIEEHSEWLQQQQHGAKHNAINPESLDNVLGGGMVHESMGQLKQELVQASARANADKERRAAAQKQLDRELIALSSQQIAAHDAHVAQQQQELRAAARHHAHAEAARKPTPAQQRAGEALLASIGAEMLQMPSVAKALTQGLSSKSLDLAREIASSLGRNATALPPIDPAIAAEAEIAAAEQEQGLPLQEDKATPALNVSGLVGELPPDLVAEMEQAEKEIEIQKKLDK